MKMSYIKHGHSRKGTVLNGAVSLTYSSWARMMNRTRPTDPRSAKYADRGITVCEEWKDFRNFLRDMGTRPDRSYSLDRIDNNKGYEPGNCRWATREEQGNNKRNNRCLEFRGETLTAVGWSRKLGIPYKTLMERLRRGWPIERALTAPVQVHRRNLEEVIFNRAGEAMAATEPL